MSTAKPNSYLFILLIFFWVFFNLKILWAEDIKVTSTVDKNSMTLEDIVTLSITVTGVQQSAAPILPNLQKVRNIPTWTSQGQRGKPSV